MRTAPIRRKLRRGYRRFLSPSHRADVRRATTVGERISDLAAADRSAAGAPQWTQARARHDVAPASGIGPRIPLTWWTDTPNFGDLLGPWLVGRMTGRGVTLASGRRPHFVTVGSIIGRATRSSIVWGSGSFGSERASALPAEATYTAVRGPLTRSRLGDLGIDCPAVYGDPALLAPVYYAPDVPQTHRLGIIIRHSEHRWRELSLADDVKLIDLSTSDVDGTIREILSCQEILSSSLHGLIIADAYGIPNAWLGADRSIGGSRPNGGEYKYHDYFASVEKLRRPVVPEFRDGMSAAGVEDQVEFDDRPIRWAPEPLLDACPFMRRTEDVTP